jgi:hypothetical protein
MSSGWSTRLLVATASALLLTSALGRADPSSQLARISFIGGLTSLGPASLDGWNVASEISVLSLDDRVDLP